jgi:hypothetical protein
VISLRGYLLRVYTIVGLAAAAIALVIVMFAGDFLHDTLGLPWRSIGAFVMLVVVVAAIVVLWRGMLRDWARRPDGSDSRKNRKQRS